MPCNVLFSSAVHVCVRACVRARGGGGRGERGKRRRWKWKKRQERRRRETPVGEKARNALHRRKMRHESITRTHASIHPYKHTYLLNNNTKKKTAKTLAQSRTRLEKKKKKKRDTVVLRAHPPPDGGLTPRHTRPRTCERFKERSKKTKKCWV